MDQLLTSFNGKMPVTLDDFRFADQANRNAFYALMTAFGVSQAESFKISGCTVVRNGNTFSCAAGYISLAGEICKVDAHSINVLPYQSAKFQLHISYDPAGLKAYEVGTMHDCYQIRKAQLVATTAQYPSTDMYYDALTLIEVIRNKVVALGDTSWHRVGTTGEPIFLNGFQQSTDQDASTVAFRKDAMGRVQLKGTVSHAAGQQGAVFTLPVGYRPAENLGFICRGSVADSVILVQVTPSGYVWINTMGTAKVWLESISFQV